MNLVLILLCKKKEEKEDGDQRRVPTPTKRSRTLQVAVGRGSEDCERRLPSAATHEHRQAKDTFILQTGGLLPVTKCSCRGTFHGLLPVEEK